MLIPNCLRSNLSYSPLAALELYVNYDNSLFNLMYNHAYALIGLGMVHNLCGLIIRV